MNKSSLGVAYAAKRGMAKKADRSPTGMEGCPDCMSAGGRCMAHGGAVEGEGSRPASHMPSDAVRQKQAPRGRSLSPDNQDLPAMEREAHLAEGGAVDDERSLHTKPEGMSPELAETSATASMSPHELLDQDMRSSADSSDDQEDLPRAAESLSLAAEVMMDRKRRKMATGGQVKSMSIKDMSDMGTSSLSGDLHQRIAAPDMSDLDNDADELDAQLEDGRSSRGLNAETAPVMTDPEHDQSDASLVAEILRDRKSRRR